MALPIDGLGSQVVYSNSFDLPIGAEWSQTNRDLSPIGARPFLGQFGNQTVVLTLTNLGAHTEVDLSFDLYIIRSWDGLGGRPLHPRDCGGDQHGHFPSHD